MYIQFSKNEIKYTKDNVFAYNWALRALTVKFVILESGCIKLYFSSHHHSFFALKCFWIHYFWCFVNNIWQREIKQQTQIPTMLEFKLYITVLDMNNIKTWRKVRTILIQIVKLIKNNMYDFPCIQKYRWTQVLLDMPYFWGAFAE